MAMILAITTSNAQGAKLMKNWDNYEVSTIQVGSDGTKFVKVWGYGRNVKKAMLQAKKTQYTPASLEAFLDVKQQWLPQHYVRTLMDLKTIRIILHLFLVIMVILSNISILQLTPFPQARICAK